MLLKSASLLLQITSDVVARGIAWALNLVQV